MKKLIFIAILLTLTIWSCAPVKAQSDTCKNAKVELRNCDSVVKHYADSMKAMWKAKHNEIQEAKVLARYQLVFGETKDKKGYTDPFLYLILTYIAFVALFVSTYIRVRIGVKTSVTSPDKFMWSYWWTMNKDVIFKYIAIVGFMYIIFRGCQIYMGLEPSFTLAVTVGAGLNEAITIWMNYNQKKMEAFKKLITPNND